MLWNPTVNFQNMGVIFAAPLFVVNICDKSSYFFLMITSLESINFLRHDKTLCIPFLPAYAGNIYFWTILEIKNVSVPGLSTTLYCRYQR